MAIVLQLILSAFQLVRQLGGVAAVLPSAALLGLTDVDALTLAMTQWAAGGAPVALAAQAIGVGILANTGLKIGIALVVGRGVFRWGVAWRLAIQGALLAAGLLLLRAWLP